MTASALHYDLPNTNFQRAIFTAAGLFALIMCPYELWGGVWPLNFTSPFFGIIMFGGMSVGAGVFYAGAFTPSIDYHFTQGFLIVDSHSLWGSTRQTFRATDITSITIERREQMEGPDDWYATINLTIGRPLPSRPLGTKEAAEKQAAEFTATLGI